MWCDVYVLTSPASSWRAELAWSPEGECCSAAASIRQIWLFQGGILCQLTMVSVSVHYGALFVAFSVLQHEANILHLNFVCASNWIFANNFIECGPRTKTAAVSRHVAAEQLSGGVVVKCKLFLRTNKCQLSSWAILRHPSGIVVSIVQSACAMTFIL